MCVLENSFRLPAALLHTEYPESASLACLCVLVGILHNPRENRRSGLPDLWHCKSLRIHGQQLNHRIIEYSELEQTYKDHGVYLLTPHRAAKELSNVSEGIVQVS